MFVSEHKNFNLPVSNENCVNLEKLKKKNYLNVQRGGLNNVAPETVNTTQETLLEN